MIDISVRPEVSKIGLGAISLVSKKVRMTVNRHKKFSHAVKKIET